MVVAVRRKIWLADRQLYERYVRVLRPLVWLPLRDVSGSIARNAAYTVYTPSSPGPELLSNRAAPISFTTPNVPDNWSVFTTGTGAIEEVGPGEGQGGAGTGYVNLSNTLAADVMWIAQTVSGLQAGDTVRLRVTPSFYDTGNWIPITSGGTQIGGSGFSSGTPQTIDYIAPNNLVGVKRWTSGPTNISFAEFSLQKIGQLDALIGGTTSLGHLGLLGVNEACLFDGATSILTITNRASIQGLTAFTLWLLFNPASAGEGNAGVLFSKSGEFELRFNSASRDLIATVNYSTTNAVRVTNETLSVNDWHTVGMRINNTDKVPEIFIDGVEASYASTTVGAGARVSNTNNLIIGNNSAVSGTLAGRLDEALLADVALSAGELRQLHLLAG